MKDFAEKHWPGWHDRLIGRLCFLIESPTCRADGIRILVEALRNDRVPAAAACEPLLAWTGVGALAAELTDLQDALCYATQGFRAPELPSPDWGKLQADVISVRRCLETVQRGGITPPVEVVEQLDSLDIALVPIVRTGRRGSATPLELLDALLTALGRVESFVQMTRMSSTQALEATG